MIVIFDIEVIKKWKDENDSITEKVLHNRGINNPSILMDIYRNGKYTVRAPEMFGENLMAAAANLLKDALDYNKTIGLIIDSDCDGFTSSALIYNFIVAIKTSDWAKNHILFYMHEGKQHGLNDLKEQLITDHIELCICPDGGSNDIDAQQELLANDCNILILDHHDVEFSSCPKNLFTKNFACINTQLTNYANKQLSGVGVVWQFVRYYEEKYLDKKYSDSFLDLVALGLCGDMQSMQEPETAYLIWKGFQNDFVITNPFIRGMIDKNEQSLSGTKYISYRGKISPMGAAFFIVPFINAITRSGTMEEKMLTFKSMLNNQSCDIIPSTKRGHKPDDIETVLVQTLRTVTNVKDRQTKAQDKAVEWLEQKIQNDNMFNDNVFVFIVPQGIVESSVAGLCCNKLMSKYDRPVCILIEQEDDSYRGSARGCTVKGLENFKEQCLQCEVLQAQGHSNAFGLGLKNIDAVAAFKEKIQTLVPEATGNKVYRVDFSFENNYYNNNNIEEIITEIAMMNDYWGTGIERSKIAIKGKFSSQDIKIYRKTTNTLILNYCGIELIMFNAPNDLCNEIEQTKGYIELLIIGECILNKFGGNINPQIEIIDYKKMKQCKYVF